MGLYSSVGMVCRSVRSSVFMYQPMVWLGTVSDPIARRISTRVVTSGDHVGDLHSTSTAATGVVCTYLSFHVHPWFVVGFSRQSALQRNMTRPSTQVGQHRYPQVRTMSPHRKYWYPHRSAIGKEYSKQGYGYPVTS